MAGSLTPRAVRLLLKDWQAAGLTHLYREERVAPAETTSPDGSPADVTVDQGQTPVEDLVSVEAVAESEVELKKGSRRQSRAAREQALQQLNACVKGCTRCQELADTRTQTVFGVGNPEAKVMFVGEAPGA
ncbi:MAG TPA: uracil-DNA glycosylase, partial [Caulifigura sp.]|nr:uracil-DNA glycosylase [Caulifigura sp.]